jgi:hypothetical protein
MNSKTTRRINKILIKWENFCIRCILNRIKIKLYINEWRERK